MTNNVELKEKEGIQEQTEQIQRPIAHRLVDRLPKAGGDIFLLTLCLVAGVAMILTNHQDVGGTVLATTVGAIVQRSRADNGR